jgi:uncharacterized protein (TIGR02246 family)
MEPSRRSARAIVTRIVEAYNAKDANALADLYHPDARYWSALDGWQEGLPVIRSHIEDLHRRLPDEQMSVDAIMTDGEVVVVEFTSSGTAPTGKPYQISFTEVIEVRDERIASVMVYLDPDEVTRIMS